MIVKAVIDEIQDGHHAVLLVGTEEIEVDWPAKYLPAGAKEGAIISIELTVDHLATKRQKDNVTNLIEKLKRKG